MLIFMLKTLPVFFFIFFCFFFLFFFFSSRRRHTRLTCEWSSDVCSSDLLTARPRDAAAARGSPPRREARVARRVGPGERGTGHCAPRARRAIRDAWRTGAAQRCPTEIGRASGRERGGGYVGESEVCHSTQ